MPITFTLTERIAATPERVFAHLTDIDRWSQWMPKVMGIEQLTPEPFGVGTQWRETRQMYGRSATEQFEVTACSPPRTLSLYVDGRKGSSGKAEYRFDYVLVPEGSGTRLELRGEISGMGWWGDLLGRLLGGMFKKAIAQDNAAFRAYVERLERKL